MKKTIFMCSCEECKIYSGEVDDSKILDSIPPQYKYKCRVCGHEGFVNIKHISRVCLDDIKED